MRVDSLATYPYTTVHGDTVDVRPILDAVCPISAPCREDARHILTKPELINRLISPNHTSTGVLSTLYLDIGTVGEIEAINRKAGRVGARVRR